MQNFTRSLDTASALPILELVRELSVGQRSIDTIEQLSVFLHRHIFPKLGPFCIEIYFLDNLSGNFLRYNFEEGPAKYRPEPVPAMIRGDQPIIGLLAETHSPVELSEQPPSPTFLNSPNNTAQLLVPIQDGSQLSGLLYVGGRGPGCFSAEFLSAIGTVAAVIGSRLKSMDTIVQLKKSMHALEYSDRLRTALYEISEQAHSSENIHDLYGKLHEKVGRLIHARNFFIALVEDRPDGRYIKFPYYIDQYDSHFQNMELKLEGQASIAGYLLKTRQPLLLTPTNFDQICREQNIECIGTRPHSWLGAPFFFDHISGVVAIQSYNSVVYTEKDKELMAFVARHIGDALNRKHSVDALQKAKERAERAEKNKSTFLANMSHEIRTPMNGILGLTDLVLHSDISGQKRDYLEMIHASAGRLLKLINNILDFSKIEAGKLELDIAPFSLRGTIAEALEILAISAEKKAIHLTVDCHDTIPDMLLGDAGKLSQILINLVGNAIKFTNKGKVALSVHQQGLHAGQSAPVELHFQVRDTGIGIPNAKINNIFKAFSQVVTTRDSTQRGTGLGLVIAGELVEMMGGKICVESKAGIGTTFYFTVRFAPGATVATEDKKTVAIAEQQAEEKSSAQPHHILLVEDEYINRTLAVTVLEREGWQVTTAENGVQALDILRDTSFDLILMDIQMPELDGYATTRAIRRQEKNSGRHIPIIAMTAYAVRGDREKCLAAGMDGYLSKPVRSDRLIDEIETVLRSNQT
ncbi:response regulator [Desulfocastanea catecholica]